jgi:hypothetical protein
VRRDGRTHGSYDRLVSENEPLKDQLEEIGTRLAWVRDYL